MQTSNLSKLKNWPLSTLKSEVVLYDSRGSQLKSQIANKLKKISEK